MRAASAKCLKGESISAMNNLTFRKNLPARNKVHIWSFADVMQLGLLSVP